MGIKTERHKNLRKEKKMKGTIRDVKVSENKMTIEVDLHQYDKAPLSSSGKNKILASTHGFQAYENGIKISLNVIRK